MNLSDYKAYKPRIYTMILNKEECIKLLKEHNTPKNIFLHCRVSLHLKFLKEKWLKYLTKLLIILKF